MWGGAITPRAVVAVPARSRNQASGGGATGVRGVVCQEVPSGRVVEQVQLCCVEPKLRHVTLADPARASEPSHHPDTLRKPTNLTAAVVVRELSQFG